MDEILKRVWENLIGRSYWADEFPADHSAVGSHLSCDSLGAEGRSRRAASISMVGRDRFLLSTSIPAAWVERRGKSFPSCCRSGRNLPTPSSARRVRPRTADSRDHVSNRALPIGSRPGQSSSQEIWSDSEIAEEEAICLNRKQVREFADSANIREAHES